MSEFDSDHSAQKPNRNWREDESVLLLITTLMNAECWDENNIHGTYGKMKVNAGDVGAANRLYSTLTQFLVDAGLQVCSANKALLDDNEFRLDIVDKHLHISLPLHQIERFRRNYNVSSDPHEKIDALLQDSAENIFDSEELAKGWLENKKQKPRNDSELDSYSAESNGAQTVADVLFDESFQPNISRPALAYAITKLAEDNTLDKSMHDLTIGDTTLDDIVKEAKYTRRKVLRKLIADKEELKVTVTIADEIKATYPDALNALAACSAQIPLGEKIAEQDTPSRKHDFLLAAIARDFHNPGWKSKLSK